MAISVEDLNFNNAVNYHYEKFPPQILEYGHLLDPIARAADAVGRFDQVLKTMLNREILLAPLRNQEAVISSRMEGTVSTMDEILEYEADFGEQNIEEARSEVIETILYRRALTAAQKAMEDGQPLSQFLVKAIHQRLLSFGRGASKSPGEYKIDQNYLTDRTKRNVLFTPISPERLQDGMDNLFTYINETMETAFLKTAITHLEFEALHPFKDGNGRVGRMLITLMLWTDKIISSPHFYISGHLEENKDAYVDTMRNVSVTGNWTPWCIFFLEAVEQQAVRNLEIAEKIRDLYEEMRILFNELLSSKWSTNALDFVFTNPVFRNNQFANESVSGIPSQTARRFANILHDHGLLRMVVAPSGRRPAMYSFEPLMELVRV